ncbi:MAG: nitroreductase family protein [Paenibacillus sp.]|nr:nitroreductase family protein [Paenibacillus sp.]
MENTKQALEFSQVVKERRSVRQYDKSYKIAKEELQSLLAEATLAPSSANMQPWKFMVIDDQDLKEQLLPIANNQQQVADASAVIAVLADLEYVEQVEKIYGAAVDAGYMEVAVKETLVANITRVMGSLDASLIKEVALFDCGLVSMQLMLSAKARGYDTVPMAGFDKSKFVEAFNIPARYAPTILIAVGKAAAPGHPTTRLPVEDVTFWNGVVQ